MKTTEIVTTHNVVIQYETAPVILRALAQVIDILIITFYTWIVSIMFIISFWKDESGLGALISTLLLLPVFFYSFLFEGLFGGQTVGKMALGIRVLNVNGDNATLGELFLRWVFRLIDIIASLGTLALIVSLSNDKSQRFGDILANTVVIKLKPNQEFSITDILKIKGGEGYVPTYPEVVKFTDEDMLLVKNSLERLKNNPTDQYKNLAKELVTKICQQLNIPEPEKEKMNFLKTVLQDYIVLTRS
jgi:uncharacterized RDD family membrane protein YckC